MVKNFYKRIVCSCLILLGAGCDSDENGNCLLSKIETFYGSSRNTTYEVFYTEGKISALRTTVPSSGGNLETTFFVTWDGERLGQIIQAESGASFKEHFNYTYSGNISTVTYYKISGSDTVSTVSEDEFYIENPADGTYYFNGTAYVIEGGNVVSTAFYTVQGEQKIIEENSYVHFAHDQGENSLRELMRVQNFLSMGNTAERVNSRNNITEAYFVNGNYTRTYEFTYDNSGNILNLSDLSTGRLMVFTYQCK